MSGILNPTKKVIEPYFSGKYDLLDAILLEGWKEFLADCVTVTADTASLNDAVVSVYNLMMKNDRINREIFHDETGEKIFTDIVNSHRDYCIESLAQTIIQTAERFGEKPNQDIVELMAFTLCSTTRYKALDESLLRAYTERLVQTAEI